MISVERNRVSYTMLETCKYQEFMKLTFRATTRYLVK